MCQNCSIWKSTNHKDDGWAYSAYWAFIVIRQLSH